MSAQLAPPASQRRHWRVYEIGAVPVQVPVVDVTDWPCCAVPEIAGRVVFAGAVPPTTPDAPESAELPYALAS